MSADLELRGLRKSFGVHRAVDSVDLEVSAGEVVALLGPSGCGKTTVLRMIAGLEVPDSGEIRIAGELVAGRGRAVPPEQRQLGMVFQSYAVFPHRSVAENVAYPLVVRRAARSRVAEQVAEALRVVKLDALAERRPHQLSGGQLQRVALARALVAQPRLLLLDEPMSNLDAALREELRAELAALRARIGVTTVLVTHDQAEALSLADRVAVMSAGKLEQVAPPAAVYAEPATPFVAGFVGANVLEGEVRGDRFITSGIEFPLPSPAAPGPATLAVHPEDIALGEGPSLPVVARLFQGTVLELRFALGSTTVRARVPVTAPARVGDELPVSFRSNRLFAKK